MGATIEQPTNLALVNDLRDYANKWETAKGRELMNKAALRIEALALRNELNEREIAALASHAPSEAAAQPTCTCGADRTGPTAEAHAINCPAEIEPNDH